MSTLEQMTAEMAERERWTLFGEYAAAVRRIDGDHLDRLLSLGAPYGFWENCGAPAPASIRRLPEGRFEFVDDGEAAVILPVYDSETPAWAPLEQRFEGLLDLLAFDPTRPARWSLRRGQALLLGSIYVGLVLEEGCALPLYSDPLRWIKADGEGTVVLDWAWAPDLLLGLDLVADSLALGERLESAMRPEIWLAESAA